jgi:ethylbenzene hydroxylase subunit beta/complex iron-sulfur molybdoenzyme family reductase subunit beta
VEGAAPPGVQHAERLLRAPIAPPGGPTARTPGRIDQYLQPLQRHGARPRDVAGEWEATPGERSELLETLIVYRWPENIFPEFARDPATL